MPSPAIPAPPASVVSTPEAVGARAEEPAPVAQDAGEPPDLAGWDRVVGEAAGSEPEEPVAEQQLPGLGFPKARSPFEPEPRAPEAEPEAELVAGERVRETEGARASAERTPDEVRQVRELLRMGETDFAYEERRYSRAPLYLILTLVVLIGGFTGWWWWFQRDVESELQRDGLGGSGELVSPPEAGGVDRTQAGSAAPDDEAAARAASPDDEAASRAAGQAPGSGAEARPPSQPPGEPPTQVTEPVRQAGEPPAQAKEPERQAAEPPGRVAQPQKRATEPSTQGAGAPAAGSAPATQAPGVAQPGAGAAAGAAAGGAPYAVHVASYKKLEQANQDIENLRRRGLDGRAVRTDLGSKGIWFRVYVGSYPTREAAEAARESILKIPDYKYAQVRRAPRP
jgi:septal ring-binding cell division protein DamX